MQLEFDMRRKVKCGLHLNQAVEGEEGVSLNLCDAVAMGDHTVAQRHGFTSVNRLIRACEQITPEMPQIKILKVTQSSLAYFSMHLIWK